MVLSYSTLFSRVLNKIDDVKELSLSENDLFALYVERLHSVIGKPRVRRMFSSIKLDDEIQEMNFTLNNSVDEDSDKDFVLEVLVIGMMIEWLEPQVNSRVYTARMIGGKEEKSLQNHYKPMLEKLQSMKTEQNKIIRDYGYMYNSYINGDT